MSIKCLVKGLSNWIDLTHIHFFINQNLILPFLALFPSKSMLYKLWQIKGNYSRLIPLPPNRTS